MTTELWGAPMSKSRGPPPDLSNKTIAGSSNGWGSLRGVGGRSSSWGILGSTWGSTWLLLRNLTPQIDGSSLKTLCVRHGPLQIFHLYPHHGIALAKYSTREEANKTTQRPTLCLRLKVNDHEMKGSGSTSNNMASSRAEARPQPHDSLATEKVDQGGDGSVALRQSPSKNIASLSTLSLSQSQPTEVQQAMRGSREPEPKTCDLSLKRQQERRPVTRVPTWDSLYRHHPRCCDSPSLPLAHSKVVYPRQVQQAMRESREPEPETWDLSLKKQQERRPGTRVPSRDSPYRHHPQCRDSPSLPLAHSKVVHHRQVLVSQDQLRNMNKAPSVFLPAVPHTDRRGDGGPTPHLLMNQHQT